MVPGVADVVVGNFPLAAEEAVAAAERFVDSCCCPVVVAVVASEAARRRVGIQASPTVDAVLHVPYSFPVVLFRMSEPEGVGAACSVLVE